MVILPGYFGDSDPARFKYPWRIRPANHKNGFVYPCVDRRRIFLSWAIPRPTSPQDMQRKPERHMPHAHIGKSIMCNLPPLHNIFKWEVGQ